MNRCSLFWGEIQVVLKVCDKAAMMEMGWTELPGQPNSPKVSKPEPVKPEPAECPVDDSTGCEDPTGYFINSCKSKDELKEYLESRDIEIDYRGSLERVKEKAVEAWKQQVQ